jgi:hypothetical protein
VQQRHDHRRIHVGHEADITWIRAEIAHEQRLLGCDRRADETLSELEAKGCVTFGIADHVGRAQLAAALVEQIDGERLERDQPRDEPRDLLEEVVEVEYAGNLTTEVEERGDELTFGFRCAGRRCVVCGMSWTH